MGSDAVRRTVEGDRSAVGKYPLRVGVPEVDVENDHGFRVIKIKGLNNRGLLIGTVALALLRGGVILQAAGPGGGD
jgi:hypothetical protein